MATNDVHNKVRIAVLANGVFPYQIGGMQKHTTYLTKHLARAGVQVDLYFIDDDAHPPAEQIHAEQFDQSPRIHVIPVPYRRLPYFPGHYYFTSWWKSRFLAQAVLAADPRPDFVYAQGYTGWAAAQYRKNKLSRMPPVGVHSHGIEALQEGTGLLFNLKNSLAPVWQRRIIGLADVNLSLGGKLNDLLTSVGVDPQTVLPAWNGIDTNWLCDEADIPVTVSRPTKFLFVGRDTKRKGFYELNHVLNNWIDDPRFEMHFVGNMSSEHRLSAANFVYHGQISDENALREIYRSSDVLLVPSHSEGMPTVILEAMASGMTIIASDVGAIRMVVDDSMGWIINRCDTEALSQAIHAAVDSDLRDKRLRGRQRVEDFTWPVCIKVFLQSLHDFQQTNQS